MDSLRSTIEVAFSHRDQYSTENTPTEVREAILDCINHLNTGTLRVASYDEASHEWKVHQWLKQAILLYFKTHSNQLIEGGFSQFYDKVPLKFTGLTPEELQESGVRIVPPATVRKGAYIAPNVILMPSYVNIGAYVDSGTMVDTWVTVGSCAQIGKNVHLSGGVGIGGVLEPLQANPTIIEDNCFIGARSEIVEGVIVEKGSVISMGVFIGQSTPIYNRHTQETSYGRVPAGSVVIPGSLPSKDGLYSRYAAIIVKQVDEKTRSKTSLNELLRDADS